MVSVVCLPAIIGTGKATAQEVAPIYRMPSLSDELAVHIIARSLNVLARGGYFVIIQGVLMVLWLN